MRVFSYSEARRQLASVLDLARKEEVIIKRRNGETFRLSMCRTEGSPFDVTPVKTGISRGEILAAVRESRER